ncbi:polymorphic toxin type 10 domain-containing protein [Microbacterium xanthum]|uniref:polymorphic toxin type 10 domain-containing protein n=1 Tax=Microbacterium xanthum TaxID=3079794 RepID=UPI003A0FEDC9
MTKPTSGPFRVDTPAGKASAILRTNPGFMGGGRTASGAREHPLDRLHIRA